MQRYCSLVTRNITNNFSIIHYINRTKTIHLLNNLYLFQIVTDLCMFIFDFDEINRNCLMILSAV